jgi:hypothetical protein
MENCHGSFYQTFKRNMAETGLPAPKELFGNAITAIASIKTMLVALDKLGKAATVAELIGATTILEGLDAILAVGASFYIGACIGSLAVATAESLDRAIICRTASISHKSHNMIRFAWRNDIYRPWLNELYLSNPKLLGAAA